MGTTRSTVGSCWLTLAIALAASSAVLTQSRSRQAGDDGSDAARLVAALGIRAGSVVAEIGAGDGELTLAMSRAVGDSGRVYSTELGDDRVAALKKAVEPAGATNVQILAADVARTNLPAGCCDAVFMRNVYHHFDDPVAMNASIFEALRPGGTVAVMDFTPPPGGGPVSPPARDADGTHGVRADEVAEELKRAGFALVSVETGNERGVLVVARKLNPAP
jgi:predicted methyltransferase